MSKLKDTVLTILAAAIALAGGLIFVIYGIAGGSALGGLLGVGSFAAGVLGLSALEGSRKARAAICDV